MTILHNGSLYAIIECLLDLVSTYYFFQISSNWKFELVSLGVASSFILGRKAYGKAAEVDDKVTEIKKNNIN